VKQPHGVSQPTAFAQCFRFQFSDVRNEKRCFSKLSETKPKINNREEKEMDDTNNLGYVKLAMVLVLSLLIAPSPAVAEYEYLNRFNPDKFLPLAYNQNKFLAQSEGESPSAAETDSAQAGSDDASQISTKELSQQSANPVGKYAFVFTQFATTFGDGDLNTGDSHLAGNITFQPIIPIPLYGSGKDEWRIVSRPTINLSIEQPVPTGGEDNFTRNTAVSDLLVPLPIGLPDNIAGRWLLALGPSFSIPTGTDDDFSQEQWAAGVTGVFGYISENWMAGMYPQTYFGIADQKRSDDKKYARFGNMFYWFFYNLTDEWQIGFNPTIQWNDRAGDGNRWNVPLGFTAAKITNWFGGKPVRIEFGVDYSVVREDDYGEVARFKFNLIPVVGRPIKKSIFGGN